MEFLLSSICSSSAVPRLRRHEHVKDFSITEDAVLERSIAKARDLTTFLVA